MSLRKSWNISLLIIIVLFASHNCQETTNLRNVIESTLNDFMHQSGASQTPASEPRTVARSQNGGITYLEMLHQFKTEGRKTKPMSSSSSAYLNTYRTLLKKYVNKITPAVQRAWKAAVPCQQNPPIKCDRYAPYRTLDGTCNNLRHPEFGKSFIPQNRFLPAEYDDGYNSPRTRNERGEKLPNVRTISNTVFKERQDKLDRRITLMTMSFGQFNEHDVIFTPTKTEDEQGNLITCCTKQRPLSSNCFPITIPRGDPFFKNRCMEFVRSSPVLKDPCNPGTFVREQINELTSYIDGSNVYGSTKEKSDKLRFFEHGLLKTSPGDLLPPREDQSSCVLTDPQHFCFFAGDKRVQEVPTLAAIHVTFVRYHNFIARKLKKLNPRWNDEIIFQETRRIIAALNQKITYEEYLPVILNKDTRRKFCLDSNCQVYDDQVDPATVNSFSVTAFRFGHSQIISNNALFKPLKGCNQNKYGAQKCPFSRIREVERIPVENTFKNPSLVFKDVDGLQLFQVTNASTVSDRKFSDTIRNKLFLDKDGNSLDLEAFDIHRGRDHGIPAYTKFREFCGLSKVVFFSTGRNGLADHDSRTIAALKRVYSDVNDIELFVGGMSEIPLPGAEVGPTFSCLLAKQYQLYKIADRFWWERRDPIVGFNSRQIRALKRVRFSKILCDMHNLPEIQPYVMLLPTIRWNQPRKCSQLPDLNLEAWRERRSGKRY